ncbi:MAG: D-aminoacyl-tRNA deacylase [Mycoplasmatota bacterium]|nr:D-aminoacyl-tRNA deacylase [Mycoplasmatota bacterium]
MKVVVQRCDKANVSVNNQIVGSINKGLMLLVGFTQGDNSTNIDYLVDKIINLRIFDDESGIMNKSLIDINGSILSISQFTLYSDTTRGRRPSYIKALSGDLAIKLYDEFNQKLKAKGIHTETGIFGAEMKVDFINDGPITIILEK